MTMHLFTSVKPKITFKKLNQIKDSSRFENYVKKVSTWFTKEWGYIHDKNISDEQAIEKRIGTIRNNAENIVLAFYGNQVVGAFRLELKEFDEKLKKNDQDTMSEVWFIYVDPTFRGLGVGRQIVQEIKRVAKDEMKASMVLLETLKPGLNHLYLSEEGKIVCDNSLDSNPTDMIRLKL
ncbi:MAG: GNAT family N-acetyltransferase [Legionella sp.]|nr:GNAT family N-acetyltransferase [Legionella sp.]